MKVRSKAHEFQEARKRRRATMVKPDSKSSGFDKIPEDVLMNILTRLPAKVVVRSMCVSQLWYSVIACRYLIHKTFPWIPIIGETTASARVSCGHNRPVHVCVPFIIIAAWWSLRHNNSCRPSSEHAGNGRLLGECSSHSRVMIIKYVILCSNKNLYTKNVS